MSLTFIGLGSNIGDGIANLQQAWRLLGRVKGVMPLALSSPYRTKPLAVKCQANMVAGQCHFVSEQWFINAVGVLESKLAAAELLTNLLAIEDKLGRTRGTAADRIIDLDILYYDEQILNEASLTVPHPEIDKRLFVLAPLNELAPDHVHPQLGKTSMQMYRRLPKSPDQMVEKISWPGRGEKN